MAPFDRLVSRILPIRDKITAHPVYSRIGTEAGLRRFQEHHVFAVWDFMTLLKALQRGLTCVDLPWRPVGDPSVRRLINAIVLAEESDDDGQGGAISHFEMYLDAMAASGADSGPIRRVLALLADGLGLEDALGRAHVPDPASRFVLATQKVVESRSLPAIASAFTLGREALIPDLFRSVVAELNRGSDGRLDLLDRYLDRHIGLDDEEHGPMARRMLESLCGDDPARWLLAERAAIAALQARLDLWDGIDRAIQEGETIRR